MGYINMEENATLNIDVLFALYQGAFNPSKYEPKGLDADLRNLASEGYVAYDGNLEGVSITDNGKRAMEAIMNELLGLNTKESRA